MTDLVAQRLTSAYGDRRIVDGSDVRIPPARITAIVLPRPTPVRPGQPVSRHSGPA